MKVFRLEATWMNPIKIISSRNPGMSIDRNTVVQQGPVWYIAVDHELNRSKQFEIVQSKQKSSTQLKRKMHLVADNWLILFNQ